MSTNQEKESTIYVLQEVLSVGAYNTIKVHTDIEELEGFLEDTFGNNLKVVYSEEDLILQMGTTPNIYFIDTFIITDETFKK